MAVVTGTGGFALGRGTAGNDASEGQVAGQLPDGTTGGRPDLGAGDVPPGFGGGRPDQQGGAPGSTDDGSGTTGGTTGTDSTDAQQT